MKRNLNLRSKFFCFSTIFGSFFGGLGTKKNNLKQMSPNFLPWRKSPKSLTETEERRRKRWKETPQTSRSKKVLTSRQKQDVNKLERRIFCFRRSQYSIFLPLLRWCRGPNWFNSLRNRNKLKGKFVSFYRQMIVSTFSTQELSFWRN